MGNSAHWEVKKVGCPVERAPLAGLPRLPDRREYACRTEVDDQEENTLGQDARCQFGLIRRGLESGISRIADLKAMISLLKCDTIVVYRSFPLD
jgi:hypothetical protein